MLHTKYFHPSCYIVIQHHHHKSILACQLQLINLPCQVPSCYCAFCCSLLNSIPHCHCVYLLFRHVPYNCKWFGCKTCLPSVLNSSTIHNNNKKRAQKIVLGNLIMGKSNMYLTVWPSKNSLEQNQLIGKVVFLISWFSFLMCQKHVALTSS